MLASGNDEEIEIADGFLAAAKRAGGRDGRDFAAELADVFGDFGGGVGGDVEADAAAGALEKFDGFENVLLGFFTEAGNVAEFAFAGEFGDVLDRAGLEFLPEERDLFRAEALERENVENRRGIFLQELLAEAVVAGLENFVDVIGHAFADAGKRGELGAVFGEIFDALGNAGKQFGGAFVAAITADDGAVDFEEERGLVKDAGDVAIFHGGIIKGERRKGEPGARSGTIERAP